MNESNSRVAVLFSSLIVLWGVTVFAAPAAAQEPQRTPPNIVFILADDLGYGEPGCYGQEKIRTPNIDRLAEEGLRFTQHYTGAPVCAPARCTLLTGKHLGHAEVRDNRNSGNGRKFPGQWPLSVEAVTIATLLQQQGYTTGAFGKWGLGPNGSSGCPNNQGFDQFFGYICQVNAHSYYPPYLDCNGEEVPVNHEPVPGRLRKQQGEVVAADYRAENYAPDLILERALSFIDDNSDKPFFLYLPFVEPHVALQPPQEWIDQYPEEWDEEHGVYRGQNGYLPHPRPRAAYAAMISDLDEHVGSVLKKLEEHGLTDNTLVIFTSDNGPTHGARDDRWSTGGAGSRFFNSTGGLRGFKGSCYEGGLRVPCIVRWPGHVTPGSETDFASYFPDWLPTLTGIAGATIDEDFATDGIDLSCLIQGETPPSRVAPMIWEFHGYGGIFAIRQGDWKAVRRSTKEENPRAWELYNIADDPREQTNLADRHPEKVTELEAAFRANRTPESDFFNRLYDE